MSKVKLVIAFALSFAVMACSFSDHQTDHIGNVDQGTVDFSQALSESLEQAVQEAKMKSNESLETEKPARNTPSNACSYHLNRFSSAEQLSDMNCTQAHFSAA